MDYKAWRLYFERTVQVPEDEINLAEAALIVASDEYPDLDVGEYLTRLDTMADHLRPHLTPGTAPLDAVRLLNRYLFEELGFDGNRDNYYDPRNSYLNDVLERRTGLPISLSILYIEIGRRRGLPLFGVGLPGHFVVKWEDPRTKPRKLIVIDPFNRGEILDQRMIQDRVRDVYNAEVSFQPEWLATVGPKYILVRLLNNLKAIFVQAEDYLRAWQVVDKLLILDPRSPENIRDMGLLSLQTGAYRHAATFLEEYLLSYGDAADAEQVRMYLRSALTVVERLN